MEALLILHLPVGSARKTVGSGSWCGNKKKRRRSKTNWDRLSYSQKVWLQGPFTIVYGKSCSLNCKIIIYMVQCSWFEKNQEFFVCKPKLIKFGD